MSPWKELGTPEDIEVVSPEGEVRCRVKAYFGGTVFFIDDLKADIQSGDEIRRRLPNGKDDVFLVTDPKFYRDGPFGSHYQIKFARRGSFAPRTGGNYNIHVSGQNSRVNIGSTDNSTNMVQHAKLFSDLRAAISDQVKDAETRTLLAASLNDMEAARDRSSFASAYQRFIASAANHMTVLVPFLPAVTQLITQWT